MFTKLRMLEKIITIRRNLRIFGCILSVLFLILISNNSAKAAVLGLYPASKAINVGNTISVKVLVNATGQAINNVDGIVSFPNDLLEVVSVSKASSIFNLWFDDPNFSNSTGEVTFNGGLPSPGYSGPSGEVVSITLKAKKSGLANITIKNSAVRANDGLGTNVLQGVQNTSISIGQESRDIVPTGEQVADLRVPDKPIVTSPSHPDQTIWSKNNTVTFNWKTPSDVEFVKTNFNNKVNTDPTVPYDRSVTERTFTSISDGVYYFHIKYTNQYGSSKITTYKVSIDTVPPEKFDIPIEEIGGRNFIKLDAKDLMSGIDNYLIKIDDLEQFRITKSDLNVDNKYGLPVLNNGIHKVKVTANDFAGNFTQAENSYTSTSIIAPKISVESKEVTRGDYLVIKGSSIYPDTNVNVIVKGNKDNKIYSVTTDKDGSFEIKTAKIYGDGSIEISSEMMFSQNIKSPLSNSIIITIHDSAVVDTSKSIIYTMSFVVPALMTIIFAILIVYIGWHKFFGLKRKIRQEVISARNSVHKELMDLKKDLVSQLENIENINEDRNLNAKEKKFVSDLKKRIDNIDKIIERKIGEIK